MSLHLPIRKQTLRLVLGVLSFLLPIALPLALLVQGSDPLFPGSLHSYGHTEANWVLILLCTLLGLVFILYGLAYSRGRNELLISGILIFIIAFFPDSGASSWLEMAHSVIVVCFLAALGWLLLGTFNLPLAFPTLNQIGQAILVLAGILLIWVVFFSDLWPPLTFVLTTAILWLFTAGIFIRHKINQKLGG